MAKDLRDNKRKNEIITGHCIPLNIYKGQNEVRKEVDRDIL